MDFRGLYLVTAPTVEPVTAAEVKLHTRIDMSTEDTLIETWIKSARRLAEDYQRRAYIFQVWDMTMDVFPASIVDIPRAPLQQVLQISYYNYLNAETILYYTHLNDETTTSTTPEPDPSIGTDNFIIDTLMEPGRVALAYGVTWPVVTLRPIYAVRFRYLAGYGATAASVPETVKDAIMLYCAYRYENRAAESGAAPKQFYDLLAPDRIHLP